MFPDTDPANKGRDSADMLRRAAARVADTGWRIVNLDCVILAQRPKILPHRPAMRRRIAEILGVEESAVWLKAKTGEGVGPIGEELAIGAECVVLVERA
jgi:2-C-methyl-D-erythritol 2,4-cyclodiphosphate synthase